MVHPSAVSIEYENCEVRGWMDDGRGGWTRAFRTLKLLVGAGIASWSHNDDRKVEVSAKTYQGWM